MQNRLNMIVPLAAVVVVAAAGFFLFQPRSSSSARAVIVDLDAVARSLGRMDDIKQRVAAANQNLLAQRAQLRANMQKQVDDAKAKFGDKPTDEQTAQLESMVRQANLKMADINRQVSLKSKQIRAGLIIKFRQDTSPIAEQLAREHGASLVLTSTDGVLWSDSAINITDELIVRMRKMKPAPSTAPKEK